MDIRNKLLLRNSGEAPRDAVESSYLRMFKKCGDVALGHVV